MNLKDIIKELNLEVKSASSELDIDVKGCYVSDLLSDVMANAEKDSLWITLQIHQNIVAVAELKDLAGIIIVNKRVPEPETLEKAEKEKVPILVTELPAFEIAGKLYSLGIKSSSGN